VATVCYASAKSVQASDGQRNVKFIKSLNYTKSVDFSHSYSKK